MPRLAWKKNPQWRLDRPALAATGAACRDALHVADLPDVEVHYEIYDHLPFSVNGSSFATDREKPCA